MTVMDPTRTDRFRAVAPHLAAVALVASCAAGCGDSPPGRTFYERNIEPILTQKCAGNTSGCHSTNAGDPYQFAAGNFDVTSFENVQKRRDVLAPFGAYPYALLLIKAVPAKALKLFYGDKFLDIFNSPAFRGTRRCRGLLERACRCAGSRGGRRPRAARSCCRVFPRRPRFSTS